MSKSVYQSRGVSAGKEEVKAAVSGQDKGLFPGSFCKILPDLTGDSNWCMALHADGAGTKSSAAYLMYKETGDPSWFRGIAQDSLVMNTDDLLAVGATGPFYLSNTIGRNAHRVPGSVLSEIISGYDDVIAKMAEQGIEIVMTGGETADVGDLVKTIICDSTVMTRLRTEDVISAANIKSGLSIVGLSSTGKAKYEQTENSGISSNGLTAARHLLLKSKYRTDYPESYSATLEAGAAYSGKYLLEDKLPGSNLSVGEAILSPTRTYLPPVREILRRHRAAIHGIIHCTGGGQVKCIDFSRGIRYVKDNLFPIPPLFQAIYESGEITEKEMYRVFNMGHRFEIYCEPEVATDIVAIVESFGIAAQVVGRTEDTNDRKNEVLIGEHVWRQ